MIIKRLVLHNYCQHTDKEIQVSGNLIAVVGHNGCGKSNMLGALQFALTGEQPGKNKADLLHWGAKEGYVILEFEQDGKPGRIERSVNSNKVTLEYDGVTTTGITPVAKEMEERLHMDKDLVRQSVFVRQTEIDTIISAKTDKREREVAFQKLLGIDAAKIHKNLTDWMYQATRPINYDVQITDAQQRLGEMEAKKAEYGEALEKAQAAIEAFPPVQDSSATLKNGVAAISAVLTAKAVLQSAQEAVVEATTNLERVKQSSGITQENPGVDVVRLSEEISALNDEVYKADRLTQATEDVKKANDTITQVVAVKPCPTEEEIAAHDAKYAEAQQKMSSASHEYTTRRKALAALNDGEGAMCPTCGKPLDAGTIERIRTEHDQFFAEYNAQAAIASEARTQGESLRKLREVAILSRHGAECALASAEKVLHACAHPTVGREQAISEVNKRQQLIKQQRDYDKAVASAKAALEQAEIKLKVANDAATAATQQFAAAESTAIDLCGQDAALDWTQAREAMASLIAETDKKRAELDSLKTEYTRLKASYDVTVEHITKHERSIADLKDLQEQQDKLAKALAVIERVRDWFHYANGPRVLVNQVLGALTDDVNRFLGNFTAPFIVTPDNEQVGFRVEFTDGRDRPEEPASTDVLSGGERVQLAVAFRLAIYCMFAGKLGLLSLDEPTAYLDDSNVDRFGILLSKVKELARNMNTQVFMATHERAVIPHMDAIIDLN